MTYLDATLHVIDTHPKPHALDVDPPHNPTLILVGFGAPGLDLVHAALDICSRKKSSQSVEIYNLSLSQHLEEIESVRSALVMINIEDRQALKTIISNHQVFSRLSRVPGLTLVPIINFSKIGRLPLSSLQEYCTIYLNQRSSAEMLAGLFSALLFSPPPESTEHMLHDVLCMVA